MKVAALAIVTMGCLSMTEALQATFTIFFWKRLIIKSQYQTPILFNMCVGGGFSPFNAVFIVAQVRMSSIPGILWRQVTNGMGQMLEQNVHNIKTTHFGPSHALGFDEAGHEKATSEVVP